MNLWICAEAVNPPKVLVGGDKKSAEGFSTEGFNLLKVS
jgi:hypothetical protein